MKLFASIYLGTNEIVMKVFEISKTKLKEVDCLRKNCDLATDVYANGEVSHKTVEHICKTLVDMKKTARMYKVDSYKFYATPLVSRAQNSYYLMDQISLATGGKLSVLSNSEHRFLSYEAVASTNDFKDLIANNAAIVDVGGAALQITLFKNGKVKTTQHISLGSISLGENLRRLGGSIDAREQISEMIHKELEAFCTMYLADTELDCLILLGDQLSAIVQHLHIEQEGQRIPGKAYARSIAKITNEEITKLLDEIDMGINRSFIEAYILLHQGISDFLPANEVFVPGVAINEGIAYDYAYENKLLTPNHDFEEDVISAAWSLAKRYGSYQPHIKALDKISMQIFDTMKKYHGLGNKERLMMRTVAILHDCGKYISIADASTCSYTIVMNSEILGLTHREREMVAMTIAYNRREVPPYEAIAGHISRDDYLIILKLLAILKIANAMDRSHKQKFKSIKMSVKDKVLLMTVESENSLTLERGLFEEKADFFENIYGIRPVIREKRVFY